MNLTLFLCTRFDRTNQMATSLQRLNPYSSALRALALALSVFLVSGCGWVSESKEQHHRASTTPTPPRAPAVQVAPEPVILPTELPTAPPTTTSAPTVPAAEAADAGTKPFEFATTAADGESTAITCHLPGVAMPPNARVYAAGAYGGAPTQVQIDDSGHEATSIAVAVNEPAAPVVLLLGAYEPTIWRIGWTPGTRIAGVLVTGYHRQQITGLAPTVPVLISTYDNHGPCGYAYVGGDGTAKLNTLARSAFGRAVETAFLARNGQAVVGSANGIGRLITDASARDVGSFQRKDVPLAGKAGLDAAVAAGVLRPATKADVVDWERAQRATGTAVDAPPIVGDTPRPTYVPYNGYVVLKPFRIPAGLYGAHSATFFIARGVPLPTGNPGHSTLLDLNTGRCSGTICREH